ncbi:MAG: PIN domain-containing protein [Burkholderiales bacterium]|nr:PIN domain-containing protein [Burkholderiales bacterium]
MTRPTKPARPASRPSSKAKALPAGAFAGAVLVDSGPLLALFNATDHWHAPVLEWLRGHPGASLISTWPVATEVCALLARRVHNEAALDFLRWARRGGITLDLPSEGSLTEVLQISERFADLPFDLADASIAEAAARLNIRSVLSVDADFAVYRDRSGRALTNLLQ